MERLAREHPGRIRGLLEPRQGVSYARNAGIHAARGDIVAFFDDDVRVAPDWIETIRRTFHERPEIDLPRRPCAARLAVARRRGG